MDTGTRAGLLWSHPLRRCRSSNCIHQTNWHVHVMRPRLSTTGLQNTWQASLNCKALAQHVPSPTRGLQVHTRKMLQPLHARQRSRCIRCHPVDSHFLFALDWLLLHAYAVLVGRVRCICRSVNSTQWKSRLRVMSSSYVQMNCIGVSSSALYRSVAPRPRARWRCPKARFPFGESNSLTSYPRLIS